MINIKNKEIKKKGEGRKEEGRKEEGKWEGQERYRVVLKQIM